MITRYILTSTIDINESSNATVASQLAAASSGTVGGRAVDLCEPTQFSVGVMCQFPRCDTSAKILEDTSKTTRS